MSDRLEELRVTIEEWSPTLELLNWAVAEIEALRASLAFLKSKGITVGTLKDGHGERLSYAIEPDSELDDTATIVKLTDAEIAIEALRNREEELRGVLSDAHDNAERIAHECIGHDLWYIASRLEKKLAAALTPHG